MPQFDRQPDQPQRPVIEPQRPFSLSPRRRFGRLFGQVQRVPAGSQFGPHQSKLEIGSHRLGEQQFDQAGPTPLEDQLQFQPGRDLAPPQGMQCQRAGHQPGGPPCNLQLPAIPRLEMFPGKCGASLVGNLFGDQRQRVEPLQFAGRQLQVSIGPHHVPPQRGGCQGQLNFRQGQQQGLGFWRPVLTGCVHRHEPQFDFSLRSDGLGKLHPHQVPARLGPQHPPAGGLVVGGQFQDVPVGGNQEIKIENWTKPGLQPEAAFEPQFGLPDRQARGHRRPHLAGPGNCHVRQLEIVPPGREALPLCLGDRDRHVERAVEQPGGLIVGGDSADSLAGQDLQAQSVGDLQQRPHAMGIGRGPAERGKIAGLSGLAPQHTGDANGTGRGERLPPGQHQSIPPLHRGHFPAIKPFRLDLGHLQFAREFGGQCRDGLPKDFQRGERAKRLLPRGHVQPQCRGGEHQCRDRLFGPRV